MNDKAHLLDQLKIDRSARRAPQRRRWPWLLAGLLLVLVLVALLFGRDRPLAVQAVSARAETAADGSSVLDASGYVVARRQATVSSKVTGKVTEVLIEEGRRVEAGQVLARIDDSNVRAQLALAEAQQGAARSQLAQLQVQLADAERQLTRAGELAQRKLISQQALDSALAHRDGLRAQLASAQQNITVATRSAELQQRALDDTVVRAPFAGVITVKNAQPGEMISPLSAGGAGTRTGIGTLVDMDSLEIEVDVNENFINRVRPGQAAAARLNAYPDWEIPCSVIAVIPTADRSKATVKVRVGFQQKDARILPEMGARVAFREAADAAPVARGVIVPAAAVQAEGSNGHVFVIREDRVERRAVQLGESTAEGLRISAGLQGGERLAVGDFAKLRDGARIRIEEQP